MGHIEIRGEGVAASCCACLLGSAGVPLKLVRQFRPRVPAVVVSLATQTLVSSTLGHMELFAGCRPIKRRIVAWGPGAEPATLPHAAVVITEDELLERIESRLPASGGGGSADWTVLAARPLPEPAIERRFGSRQAWAAAAEMKTPDEPACWIESLCAGWLFLIPGWLIAVGGAPETLLAESRLVAGEIRRLRRERAEFPAYPRIADPVGATGWLACGSAAMAYDPICGDGTGNAVREAILAAAVIKATARGEPEDRLVAHYRRRLVAGFQRHLELSLEFYRAGNSGPWWDEETAALERGVAWCTNELESLPPFRYRLDGYDLLPVAAFSGR